MAKKVLQLLGLKAYILAEPELKYRKGLVSFMADGVKKGLVAKQVAARLGAKVDDVYKLVKEEGLD